MSTNQEEWEGEPKLNLYMGKLKVRGLGERIYNGFKDIIGLLFQVLKAYGAENPEEAEKELSKYNIPVPIGLKSIMKINMKQIENGNG